MMDAVVKKFSFDNYATPNTRTDLKEALDVQLRAQSKAHVQDITEQAVAALAALTDKVSSKDFPSDASNACQMAIDVFKVAEFLAENVAPAVNEIRIVSADQAKPLQAKIQATAFKLLVICFHHGPTGGHLELMKEMLKSSLIDTCAFIRGLDVSSTEFRELLLGLQQEFIPRDFEKSASRYRANVCNVLKSIFDLIRITEGSMRLRRKEITGLYMHAVQCSGMAQEDNAKVHLNLLELLHRKFSPGGRMPQECFIFSSCKESSALLRYLDGFKKHISDADFPRHDTAVTGATQALSCYLGVYREEGAGASISDAVKVVSYCCQQQKSPLLKMGEELSAQCAHFSNKLIHAQNRAILQSVSAETQLLLKQSDVKASVITSLSNIFNHLVFQAWANESDSTLIVGALPFIVRCNNSFAIKLALKAMDSKGKLVAWNDEAKVAKEMVNAYADVIISKFLDSDEKWREVLDHKDILDLFLKQARRRKVLDDVHPELLELIGRAFNNPTYVGSELLPRLEEFVTYKLAFPKPACADCDICKKSMAGLHGLITKGCSLLETENNMKGAKKFSMAVFSVLQCIITQISETQRAWEFSRHVKRIFDMLCEGPYEDSNGEPVTKCLLASPALVFVNANATTPAAIEDLVPVILKLCSCPAPTVRDLVCQIGLMALQQCPEVLCGHLDKLWSTLREEGYLSVIYCLKSMYKADVERDKIHAQLHLLIEHMQNAKLDNQQLAILLMTDIAKISGENIKAEHLRQLKGLFLGAKLTSLFLELLRTLADTNSTVLVECKDLLYFIAQNEEKYSAMIGIILSHMATTIEALREETIDFLLKGVENGVLSDKIVHLGRLKMMALQDPSLMKKHKQKFQEFHENPNLATDCRYILDAIDGNKSLDELRTELEEQRSRVSSARQDAERRSATIEHHFNTQAQEMRRAKPDIRPSRKKKTRSTEEQEEQKPVTNAPIWAKDVNELLNTPSPADWRLLATHLGYTVQQRRAWTTDPYPCMTVLDDWFSKNTGDEALEKIMQIFFEMGRQDVLQVIANPADKTNKNSAAAKIIAERIMEENKVCPVFISYEGSQHAHAKLLQSHLNTAGFDAFVSKPDKDEGGDKVTDKLTQRALRQSTVVVCCVDENYVNSETCRAQVTEANSLDKPLIPILMEKIDWPPEGGLKSLFSDLQFTRFYCKDAESPRKNAGQKGEPEIFWTTAKMRELLGRIGLHVKIHAEVASKEH